MKSCTCLLNCNFWLQCIFERGAEVRLLGLGEDDCSKIVDTGKVHGLAGETCHGRPINVGEVSVCIGAVFEEEYPMYEPINGDDPPITCLSQCREMFIVWPLASLIGGAREKVCSLNPRLGRHACRQ